MLLLVVLICHYTFFVAYCAVVAAMVPLVAFCNNDLGGEFSQSDSLLTHVLGVIIVAEPCICWESGCDVWTLVSATHLFSHAKILTVLVMLHFALCCIRPVELHLLHYNAIGRYRLCRACYIINMLFYKFER